MANPSKAAALYARVARADQKNNLGTAFKNFFEGRAKILPNFKKKGIYDSFCADNGPQKNSADAVAVKDRQIRLPAGFACVNRYASRAR